MLTKVFKLKPSRVLLVERGAWLGFRLGLDPNPDPNPNPNPNPDPDPDPSPNPHLYCGDCAMPSYSHAIATTLATMTAITMYSKARERT